MILYLIIPKQLSLVLLHLFLNLKDNNETYFSLSTQPNLSLIEQNRFRKILNWLETGLRRYWL